MTIRVSRRVAAALAVGLMTGLPAAAFVAAPAHATSVSKAPGSRLAGINTTAIASAAQIDFKAPGIVPVGNSAIGDLFQVSLPYVETDGSTGPSSAGLGSPAWPGAVAANAGNSVQTFAPTVPKSLVTLLNDPIVARSTYPEQLNVHKTQTFAPAASTGVGTASTTSTRSGTSTHAAVNDTSPLGAVPGASSLGKVLNPILKGSLGGLLSTVGLSPKITGKSLLDLGSATANGSTTINVASVATHAQSHLGHVTIAGIIKIDGISSNAYAASTGKKGSQHSNLKVGKVTVAGVPASIGPKGLTLKKKPAGGLGSLITKANKLLKGLQKSGVTIRTIVPIHHVKGSKATVRSGAVQIEFAVKSVPNLAATIPQLPLPLPNSAAISIDLGLAQTSADATRLPPIGKVHNPPTSPPSSAQPTGHSGGTGPSGGIGGTPSGNLPPATGVTGSAPPVAAPFVAAPAATIFGIPTRVAWVVLAFLLSLLIAGPLLAYANWQLLRGRTS